jgi:hypothetical protein
MRNRVYAALHNALDIHAALHHILNTRPHTEL